MARKPKNIVDQAYDDLAEIEHAQRRIDAKKGFRSLTQAQIEATQREDRIMHAKQWLNGQEYDLARITVQVQESVERISTEFLRIGTLLNAVKKVEGHGFFSNWLADNFSFSHRMANYFMFVAAKLEQRPELTAFSKGGVSKAIALLELPEDYQTEFIEKGTIEGEGLDKYLSMSHRELCTEVKRLSGKLDKIVDEETKGLKKERDAALAERDQAVQKLSRYENVDKQTVEENIKAFTDAFYLFVKEGRQLLADERINERVILGELFAKVTTAQDVLTDLYDDLGELARDERHQER